MSKQVEGGVGHSYLHYQYMRSTVKLLSPIMSTYFNTELCCGKSVDFVHWFLFHSCNIFKQAFLFVIINQNELLKSVLKRALYTHSAKYRDPEYGLFLSLNPNLTLSKGVNSLSCRLNLSKRRLQHVIHLPIQMFNGENYLPNLFYVQYL